MGTIRNLISLLGQREGLKNFRNNQNLFFNIGIKLKALSQEAAVLNFYDDSEQNLVVTSVNILTVYRIRTDDLNPKIQRLELTDEFELSGNICSICRVRFNGATKDSILLSFDEAKCSIVEYETESGGLATGRLETKIPIKSKVFIKNMSRVYLTLKIF